MAAKLGILAGGGDLPRRLVNACRASGRDFFVIAIEGQTDPDAVAGAPHEWVRLGAAGKALKLAKAQAVKEIVMAGHVRRPSLAGLRPDARTLAFFVRVGRKALGDDGLLRAVIDEIEGEGFRVIGLETLLPELVPDTGPLGIHRPDEQAEQDIARGLAVLNALGIADVGQAVVVQGGLVLGLEAIEGTDALIDRCGALRREGAGGVLVKTRKPGQESRVDLPTIGPETVRRAVASGLRGIAVEARGTLIIDREETIRAANAAGLFLLVLTVER